MTACLLYAKIHKNKAENLLHLMLYFSFFKQNQNLLLTKGTRYAKIAKSGANT